MSEAGMNEADVTQEEITVDDYAVEIIQNLQENNLALDDEAALIRAYLLA